MAQGISPNNLNKISEVYLSQISEHHKKDADGNTIPHEDELDEAKKPMVKVKLKDPSKIKVKVTDIGPGGKEYVRKNEMDEAMAMKPSNMKKKAKLSAALKRLEDLKVASKMKEEVEDTEEGMQYGIFKGDGKPKGAMAAFGKKKKKEKKVKMEGLSNWKEDYVWEADEEQMEKEIKEKKVKNKITINPKLGEAVEELGGQLIDVQEMNGDKKEDDPQLKSKMLRQRQLKKQVLLRKLQAVRQTGGEDIVASYEPEGEQLDEYGNPRVGVRLRVARAIDKVNPKPKMGSKRTAISNKLKMSAIKGETKRREQKENPYSLGKKMKMVVRSMSEGETIDEEGYDIARDMGKVPPTKGKKDATTMPPSKEMMKTQKVNKGPSALDIVKSDIRKKYGKGAIMGEAKVDKGMIFGKSAARNERRFGKKGHFDPSGSGPRGQGTSERAQLAVKRGEEHKARRGVKTKGMNEAKGQLDEDPIKNLINKLRTGLMNKTRNNPNFKIPLPGGGSIDSEAKRINKYDAATGGEFSKMLK